MNTFSDARTIIVGGGAIGAGCAYALAKAGQQDILVIERADDVGLATTSQGAGLCGQLRDSRERIELAMHSVRTFRDLQATDVKPDWNEVGSLRIALTEKRGEEFSRLQSAAADAHLEVARIDAGEASRLWPLMDFRQAKAILWCPSDGFMTPRSVTASYRHNASQLGVRFSFATALEAICQRDGRITGIKTNRGNAECRWLVNAAGANAWHVAHMAGLDLPIVPVRHEYFVSVPMEGLLPTLPCFRLPDLTLYGRVRDQGLLLGGWEPRALRTDPRSYTSDHQPPAVVTDWTVLDSFSESFSRLFPAARTAESSWVGKGWPTFTPDGRFLIGESCRVPGFVMAAGCNAHGISGSGGIGKLLVEALLEPHPSEYVKSLSPDRFTETSWSWDTAIRQAARVYETYYGA